MGEVFRKLLSFDEGVSKDDIVVNVKEGNICLVCDRWKRGF